MESRDHREVGRRLDLFHFQEEAPGMVFWHPRGLSVLRELEGAVRRILVEQGYEEVRTPLVLRRAIWEASGHWSHFEAGMFRLEDAPERACALKPVSCPAHLELALRRSLSYRDLPLRLAELGMVHRREPSGALAGLLRLQQFTQDDGHILCAPEQVGEEVARFLSRARRFYQEVGFAEVALALSTRPGERLGDDAAWDHAEAELGRAAEAAGFVPVINPGGGAFYGPKLELSVLDHERRPWQCGTIQLDPFLPQRFGVRYADAAGVKHAPWMLHRAVLGSLERFLGLLLERTAGHLPPWLAAEQVIVAPVAEAQAPHAGEVVARLRAIGARVRLDDRALSLARRAHDARALGVPYFAVVGRREVVERGVALRGPDGERSHGLEGLAPHLERLLRHP